MPILDCPTNAVPPLPTCVVGITDIEFGCSSVDGRLICVQLVQAADCTITREIVEIDGSPLIDSSTVVSCGIDYELTSSCYQDISSPSIQYERILVIDPVAQSVIATLWLDSAGAVISAPANIEPCKEQIVDRKAEIQRLSSPYSVIAPYNSVTVTAISADVVVNGVSIPSSFTWSVDSEEYEQFVNQVDISGSDYIVTEVR